MGGISITNFFLRSVNAINLLRFANAIIEPNNCEYVNYRSINYYLIVNLLHHKAKLKYKFSKERRHQCQINAFSAHKQKKNFVENIVVSIFF